MWRTWIWTSYQPLVYLAERDANGNRPYTDSLTNEPLLRVSPVALNNGECEFVLSVRRYCRAHQMDVLCGKQVYLLRNESRKGLGFFEANNFYPDFILWILDGERQYVTFVDPKGIRNLKGLDDPKIQLYKLLQTEVEKDMGNPNLLLNSFIVSNTPMKQVEFWSHTEESAADFTAHHVLFKDHADYLDQMFGMILDRP